LIAFLHVTAAENLTTSVGVGADLLESRAVVARFGAACANDGQSVAARPSCIYDKMRVWHRVLPPSPRPDMTVTDRVEIDPRVMLGKPVIRGTRIPVELLLRKLSEGASESDLIDAYPRLTREDIQAAIRYAADTLAHEEVVFVTPTQPEPRG
jgi:uncharacterized protein (DUF433 family)